MGAQHAAGTEMVAVKATGDEAGQLRVVDRFDAAVRRQVHGRCPTARHGDQVDLEPLVRASRAAARLIET